MLFFRVGQSKEEEKYTEKQVLLERLREFCEEDSLIIEGVKNDEKSSFSVVIDHTEEVYYKNEEDFYKNLVNYEDELR